MTEKRFMFGEELPGVMIRYNIDCSQIMFLGLENPPLLQSLSGTLKNVVTPD